jgi:hypothetical protein
MIRFLALLFFAGIAVLLASLMGGSGFLGVVLLAALVGFFAIIVMFLNEIRRVMN